MSIHHDREDQQSDVTACVVNLTLETRDRLHAKEIKDTLHANGYPIS